MRILRNHILNEFIHPFLYCLLGLLFLFMCGRGMIQMADLVFNKSVSLVFILRALLYTLPFIIIFLIPVAVLVATLLTFGKLSYDNEIMAIRAAGLGITKTVMPLFVSVILFCLCSFYISDQIASTAHYAYTKLMKQIGIENPQAALEEGTFIKKFKNFVIFIYEIDKNKLKGIRIYQPQEGKPTRTIVAQKGEIISVPENNLVKLHLIQGTSDEPDQKDPTKLYKLNFKTYDFPLNISEQGNLDGKPSKKGKDMSIRELRDEIKRLKDIGVSAQGLCPLYAEIHHKIALSVSSFAFLLIGIPLGITTRRSDKWVNFGMSLPLMIAHWALLVGGKGLAQKGAIHPFIALEFGNFLVGGIGLYLFIKLAKNS